MAIAHSYLLITFYDTNNIQNHTNQMNIERTIEKNRLSITTLSTYHFFLESIIACVEVFDLSCSCVWVKCYKYLEYETFVDNTPIFYIQLKSFYIITYRYVDGT